jgi:hypothetical protein
MGRLKPSVDSADRRHSGSKRSVLLAGNATAAEHPIRASESLGSDDLGKVGGGVRGDARLVVEIVPWGKATK